jgi:hypothetical protein
MWPSAALSASGAIGRRDHRRRLEGQRAVSWNMAQLRVRDGRHDGRRFALHAGEFERERQHDNARVAKGLRERRVAVARRRIGEQDVDADDLRARAMEPRDELGHPMSRKRPLPRLCDRAIVDHRDDDLRPRSLSAAPAHLGIEGGQLDPAQPRHVGRDRVQAGEHRHQRERQRYEAKVARARRVHAA